MLDEFYASDVTKITEVKLNRLQPWMERGWITPSIQKATGHGTRNIFSLSDLLNIAFFKKAVESGLSRKAISQLIKPFNDYLLPEIKSIHEGKISFPKPYYILFFRKKEKVIGTAFERAGMSTGFIKFTKSYDADDVIGINISNIMEEVFIKLDKKISFYF